MATTATMPRVRATALLLAVILAWSAVAAAQKPAAPPAKKNPLLKLVEPWPSPEKLTERRTEAEQLPLFAGDDVVNVTLVGDFKAINKDHDANSRQKYPGAVRLAEGKDIPVEF